MSACHFLEKYLHYNSNNNNNDNNNNNNNNNNVYVCLSFD